MNATVESALCNCNNGASKIECHVQLRQLLNRMSAQLGNDFRTDPERLANADLYSIVILCLFAAIIIIIMIRAIRPSESLDDQVTAMLTSMRSRCDDEDDLRYKMQLHKAKLKTKKWLNEAKLKTTFQIRKLSFSRSRSTGPNSVKSQVISNVTVPLKSPCHRAASVQCITFVPEIVVTSTRVEDEMAAEDSSPQSSRQLSSSRNSSTQSLDNISQESFALDPFMDV